MGFIEDTVNTTPLPKIVRVKKVFDSNRIENVAVHLARKLENSRALQKVKPGMRIAVSAGSRGVDAIDQILAKLMEILKEKGAVPFIFPAMGSHGGATAEGQKRVLAALGITQSSMGVPIVSSMEVDCIGAYNDGRPILLDRCAHEADGIVVVNRVKAHTSFHGVFESGLMKMMAIGMGKQKGAESYHQTGYLDLPEVINRVGNHVLRTQNILFGVAAVENAYGRLNILEVLDCSEIPEKEKELLLMSKKFLPRLFTRELDVLSVQEIGKDISGTGMDSNIVGRYNNEFAKTKDDLVVKRICVLDLSEKSKGNASGMGFGDIITKRLYNKFIPEQTYPNGLTSTGLRMLMVPMVMESDKLALQAAIKTSALLDKSKVRMALIENTKNTSRYYISENLIPEALEKGILILEKPFEIPFTGEGTLKLDYQF